jgi:hypothetical protein
MAKMQRCGAMMMVLLHLKRNRVTLAANHKFVLLIYAVHLSNLCLLFKLSSSVCKKVRRTLC